MSEIVYRLPDTPWAPRVVREAAELRIEIGVDFDRGYDIREFRFPITQGHLDVIRDDLVRHLLLWCVIERLRRAAGREGTTAKPDEEEAQRAIALVLMSPEAEVEAYFARERISTRTLIAHGARPELLGAGKLFAALGENPSPAGNRTWPRLVRRPSFPLAALPIHPGTTRYEEGPGCHPRGRTPRPAVCADSSIRRPTSP